MSSNTSTHPLLLRSETKQCMQHGIAHVRMLLGGPRLLAGGKPSIQVANNIPGTPLAECWRCDGSVLAHSLTQQQQLEQPLERIKTSDNQ